MEVIAKIIGSDFEEFDNRLVFEYTLRKVDRKGRYIKYLND